MISDITSEGPLLVACRPLPPPPPAGPLPGGATGFDVPESGRLVELRPAGFGHRRLKAAGRHVCSFIGWRRRIVLIVPKRSLIHLNSANESEIARLESVHKEHGHEWPEGFDVNDISLHEIVRDQLQVTNLENSAVVKFDDWKGLWFLIRLIPRNIVTNEATLSREDAATLMDVYNQKKRSAER